MKKGNWIAIDKNLAKHFPDRKYSEIEAAFSLTLDYDNNKMVTVSGYAKLWQWSRSKVRSFLDAMGIEITYPEDTGKKQKQKGQIKKQIKDRSETEKGQIRMVDTKCLESDENRKKTEKGQKKDRSKNTTTNPTTNPNTNPKNIYTPEFEKLSKDYPNINGSKSQAFKNYKSSKKKYNLTDDQIYIACMNSAQKQKDSGNENFIYQLSNVLGQKYSGDLPELFNYQKQISVNKIESEHNRLFNEN